MVSGLKITSNGAFRRWSLGARALAGGFKRQAPQWELANDEFFAETQKVVHVITGNLKRSGRAEVSLEGPRVVAIVGYGGGEVDYAQYEIDRGGDHDFLGRGWEASQGTFQAIFGRTWLRVIAAWQ